MAQPKDPTLVLSDLANVGPLKPLGYLPLKDITAAGREPLEFAKELEAKGLRYLLLKKDTGINIPSGALFVWDDKALFHLLDANRSTLRAYGWSATPEQFVRDVAFDYAPPGKLFDLVADAFNDKTNRGRSDYVEKTLGDSVTELVADKSWKRFVIDMGTTAGRLL